MKDDDIEWGNIGLGDLSPEDLLRSDINIVVANKIKAKDPKWLHKVKTNNSDPLVIAKRKASMPDQSGENNPFYNKTHTEETRKKISESCIGKEPTFKGKKHTEESMTKMRKPRSEEGKNNMRKPRVKKSTCQYCGKTGASGNMQRYHGNNCKHKPIDNI